MEKNKEKTLNNLFISSEEYNTVIYNWNDTESPYPKNKTIHQLFEEQVERTPNNIAVIFEDIRLTYKELNKKSNQLAFIIRETYKEIYNTNLLPDTLIPICVEKSHEMIIGILGILKAGGAYVPIASNLPDKRIKDILNNTGAKLILTEKKILRQNSALQKINNIIINDTSITSFPKSYSFHLTTNSKSLAYVIYTSGSTGSPNGVMIEHRSFINYYINFLKYTKIKKTHIVDFSLSIGFDAAITTYICPLLHGNTISICPKKIFFNPINYINYICINNISIIKTVPSYFKQFSHLITDNLRHNIKTIILGGEKLTPDIFNFLHKNIDIKIINEYGPTETTIGCTQNILMTNNTVVNSIGKPFSNNQVFILNKNLLPTPIGTKGELYIGGDGLARGYLNNARLTKKKFIENPFVLDKEKKIGHNLRIYKTGDIGRWLPDGNIEFIGRTDDQVKISGNRIELGEIENKLSKYPLISQCVIKIYEKEDIKYICAYYSNVKNKLIDNKRSKDENLIIDTWRLLYNQEYNNITNEYLNKEYIGWNSSYTGRQIARNEMHEWRKSTIKRIMLLKPYFVYEIGCGNGLIMSPLLSHVHKYLGIDFSKEIISKVKDTLNKLNITNAKVYNVKADVLDTIPDLLINKLKPDTIIINSVIQYFPDISYLEKVLTKSINVVEEGKIFIGDIRDFRLIEEFHISVQIFKFHKKNNSIENIVKQNINKENELLVAPEFFIKFATNNKKISYVEILPKKGKFLTEMNKFRYDVILHISSNLQTNNKININWSEFKSNASLTKALQEKHEYLAVCNYPNKRIVNETKLVPFLSYNTSKLVSEYTRLDSKNKKTLMPENLYKLAKKSKYKLYITLSISDKSCYNLIFYKKNIEKLKYSLHKTNCQKLIPEVLYNSPAINYQKIKISVDNLRNYLSTMLPTYMIPSFFIELEKLPLNTNGKIDKKALPYPEFKEDNTNYMAPRNHTEKILASIWCKVLNLKKIGIHDNFFHFGGNSLSSIRIIIEVKKELNINLNYTSILEHPTISQFYKQITKYNNELLDRDCFKNKYPINALKKFPLSDMQNNIWFDIQATGNELIYNEHITVYINSNLDISRLESCINLLIKHHEQLRTKFKTIKNKIWQIVEDELIIKLKYFDLSVKHNPENKFRYYANIFIKEIFNLNQTPLIRFFLFKLDNNNFKLLIVFHHIISDATSINKIFLPNLKRIYEDKKNYNKFKMLKLPVSYYYNVLNDKKNILAIDKRKIDFWEKFAEEYKPSEFPPYGKNKKLFIRSGSQITFQISKSDTMRIKAIAKANNVSLFTILLSFFYLSLYKYTENKKICINTVIDGRNDENLVTLFGNILQNLLLSITIGGKQSFQDFIKKVHNRNIEIYKNKIPYNLVLNTYRRKKYLENFSNIAFVLEPRQELEYKNWYFDLIQAHSGAVKDKILLDFDEKNNTLLGRLEYDYSLYKQSFIHQFISNFLQLISNIILNPNKRLSEYSCLAEKEYNKIVYEWNKTETIYPDITIHQLFEEQTSKNPNNIAIVFKDKNLTYKELNEKSNQLSIWIRKKYKELYDTNLMPDSLVPICIERSLELIIGILGILKAGGAYVPIDPNYPSNRIEYILHDTDAKLILTQNHIYENKNLPAHITPIIINNSEIDKLSKTNSKQPSTTSQSLAYIIYTSGSTGNPKGVMIEHKSLVNQACLAKTNYNITDEDNILQFSNINSDISVEEIFPCLITGSSLILKDKSLISPYELINLIKNYKITLVDLPTSYWNELVNTLNTISIPECLRLMIIGGEKVDIKKYLIWNRFIENKVRLINTYGPTEATVIATIFKTQPSNKFFKKYTDIPIGKPIQNYKLYVLDSKLNPTPIGVKGELCIGGVGIARGYLNNDTLTKEKFITNPFVTDAEQKLGKNLWIYRTGDIVRWLSDGTIEFSGRIDNQVKIHGHRIELEEIENTLSKHPFISQCIATIYQKNPEVEYSDKQLCLYYVLKKDARICKNSDELKIVDKLRKYLKKLLPDYMVPSFFVKLKKIPLTINGKIDKKSLPALNIKELISINYTSPKTQTEKELAQIWLNILKLTKISIHDNFFHIGGHSLLSISLITAINEKFKKQLKIKDIFNYPTIYELANYINNGHTIINSCISNISNDLKYYEILLSKINTKNLNSSYKQTNILLTGASGFLGIYLLESLIKNTNCTIYCLIRGKNIDEIYNKILKRLTLFNKEFLYDFSRIIFIKGNLGKTKLGLSSNDYNTICDKVDIIYHNGAKVNHVYNYETLKYENVNSTYEIIKISSTSKLKKINYISTNEISFLPTNVNELPYSFSGYEQTKFISEQILLQASHIGIPTTIFRPGNITGDSITAKSNYINNNLLLLLKSCIQLGCAPNFKNETIEMTPVDILSKKIIQLGQNDLTLGKTYNLANPNNLKWIDYITKLNTIFGYKIRLIDTNKWKNIISKMNVTNALYQLKDYYLNYKDIKHIEITGVSQDIDPNLSFQDDYDKLIRLYIAYLQKVDFLPKPK